MCTAFGTFSSVSLLVMEPVDADDRRTETDEEQAACLVPRKLSGATFGIWFGLVVFD